MEKDLVGSHAPWAVPDAVRRWRPEAAELLDACNRQASQEAGAELLELIRMRIGALLGNHGGQGRRSTIARDLGLSEEKVSAVADYASSRLFSARDRACLAFAEQMMIDIAGMGADGRAGVCPFFDRRTLPVFTRAVYVSEATQRLEVMGALLFGAGGSAHLNQKSDHGGLLSTWADYSAAVQRGDALDPVVDEFVRLRCARTHNCRICQSLRLVEAYEAGLDEEAVAKVDFYESSDLGERFKVALRIVDAFIIRPPDDPRGLVAQAHEHFSEEQLVELCLDITKWSAQKVLIALGTDGADDVPRSAAGIGYLGFGADGRVSLLADAPQAATT